MHFPPKVGLGGVGLGIKALNGAFEVIPPEGTRVSYRVVPDSAAPNAKRVPGRRTTQTARDNSDSGPTPHPAPQAQASEPLKRTCNHRMIPAGPG